MSESKIKSTTKKNTDSDFSVVNKNVRKITNILLSAGGSLSSSDV